MNAKCSFIAVACTALLTLVCGCNKSDQSMAPEKATPDSSTGAISSAVTDLKEQAREAAANVKATADAAVENTKQAAQNLASATNSKVESVKAEAQSLIDKTKAFISEKKYEDALASLKQLSNLSLTPEQQKAVDNLKAQLQKLITSGAVTNAASAVGNLFNK
jgi:hypothetical protein